MKKVFVYCGALAVLALGACKKEGQPVAERPVSATVITPAPGGPLPNVVAAGDTLLLTTCNTYVLNGKCYIDSLATIIIQRGVTIKGVKKATPAEASALVVTRGGKIFAQGTATQPITFTSNETTPAVGDWGGVVILGKDSVNKNNPAIEGIDLPSLPAGINVGYGGTTAGDNSGIFQYVRILYAGASVSANNELNGLTLGGVGNGTTIDHIYVAFGADDAFECFGGAVNLKYIIARSTNDDAFDFDFGYKGAVQFALAFVKTADNAFNADANGIECDNDGTGSPDKPQTRPVISNMTIIGGQSAAVSGTLHGNRWRRATNYIIRNSIIMGYNYGAWFQDGVGNANFQYNVVHGFTAPSNLLPLPSTNVTFTGGTNSNAGILLRAPFGADWCSQFDARPQPVSPAVTNAPNYAGLPATGTINTITTTNYRGAFSHTATTNKDWAAFSCDATPCN